MFGIPQTVNLKGCWGSSTVIKKKTTPGFANIDSEILSLPVKSFGLI